MFRDIGPPKPVEPVEGVGFRLSSGAFGIREGAEGFLTIVKIVHKSKGHGFLVTTLTGAINRQLSRITCPFITRPQITCGQRSLRLG